MNTLEDCQRTNAEATREEPGRTASRAPLTPAGWRHRCRQWQRRLAGLWPLAGLDERLRRRVQGLGRHEAELRRHTAEVEAAFLATGEVLQTQSNRTDELLAEAARLQPYLGGTGVSVVRPAVAAVLAALDALDEFETEAGRLVAALQRHRADLHQLQHGGDRLERAIAPLRTIDTLFRIEAATLPAEMQAAFAALTHDISTLHGRVREAFETHLHSLLATCESIDRVVDDFERRRAARATTMRERRRAIREALAALEREEREIAAELKALHDAVSAVGHDINDVVVALQYQDITRQKLEHIADAIAALVRRAEGGGARREHAYLAEATRLQASQVAAVDNDLATAVTQLDAGLTHVRGRLEQVGRGAAVIAGERAAAALGELHRLLGCVAEPMREVAADAATTATTVACFDRLTADFAETVDELTWGIRLIALNAQVQSAQVERCDGLEVLARETYRVSQETSHLAETVGDSVATLTGSLREAGGAAKRFAAGCAERCRVTDAATGKFATALGVEQTTILDATSRIDERLAEAHGCATRLQLDRALGAVDREPLRALRRDLETLSEWCGRKRAGAWAVRAARDELHAQAASYTMASEHEVHREVLAPQVSRRLAKPREAGMVGATSSLGENVELF